MKTIFLIFSVFLSFSSFTQFNLVPNPSFEDTLSCPSGGGQIYLAFPWYNPTNGSPDYFNSCFTWPGNNYSQSARTGIGKAGADIFEQTSTNFREYIATRLVSPLVTNKKYCIEFYVLTWNRSLYGTSNIGIYLSSDSIFSNNYLVLPYLPQVVNPQINIIEDTVNWSLISGEYIAQGGESYIVIGNFDNDNNIVLDTITQQDTMNYYAYYFIDDVSVTFCDTCTKPIAKFNYSRNDLTATFNNLTSGSATNWHWDFGDGKTDTAQNPVHVYDNAGNYTVTFVACNFICCDTMQVEISVSVGVRGLGVESSGFGVYPNPTKGEISVFLNNYSVEKLTLSVSDVVGRKMKEYIFSQQKLSIPGELEEGVYFLTLYSDGNLVATEKLLVIR